MISFFQKKLHKKARNFSFFLNLNQVFSDFVIFNLQEILHVIQILYNTYLFLFNFVILFSNIIIFIENTTISYFQKKLLFLEGHTNY